jgi:hypothetical protein
MVSWRIPIAGDRHHPWPDIEANHPYLRVVVAQAARVALIKPDRWERHALGSWIESTKRETSPQRAGDCAGQLDSTGETPPA